MCQRVFGLCLLVWRVDSVWPKSLASGVPANVTGSKALMAAVILVVILTQAKRLIKLHYSSIMFMRLPVG